MGGKNRDYSPLNIPGESSMGNHSPSVNESFDFNKKENINRALFPNIKSSLSKIQITEMETETIISKSRGISCNKIENRFRSKSQNSKTSKNHFTSLPNF